MKSDTSNATTLHKKLKEEPGYTLYIARHQGKQYLAKLFTKQNIEKYNLKETLSQNMYAFLEEYENLPFKKFILPIKKEYTGPEECQVIMTEKYDMRLSELINKKMPTSQTEVMGIAKNLIQGLYGLLQNGIGHANIRPDHFVKHQGVWKLESLVFEQKPNSRGLKNEYTSLRDYKTPEYHQNLQYQMKSQFVWDFGSMIIDLLLGNHLLKDQVTLNRFKNQPFSFEKLGINIGKTFSSELREILGKMCHHNPKERMKLQDLLLGGFFSKDVAIAYEKYKASSKPGPKPDLNPISNPDPHSDRQPGPDQSLYSDEYFQIEVLFKKSPQNFKNLFIQFMNVLDKGEMLIKLIPKCQKALTLQQNTEKLNSFKALIQYALLFIKAMDLCHLFAAITENRKIRLINVSPEFWDEFKKSDICKEVEQTLYHKKEKAIKELDEVRKKILQKEEVYLGNVNTGIKMFVKICKPELASFGVIKSAYREIMRVPYELVSWYYLQNLDEKWAKIGMYMTYCLTIDKLYNLKNISSNFDWLLNLIGQKSQQIPRIPFSELIRYIQEADKKQLVKNSNQIISKYYKI